MMKKTKREIGFEQVESDKTDLLIIDDLPVCGNGFSHQAADIICRYPCFVTHIQGIFQQQTVLSSVASDA